MVVQAGSAPYHQHCTTRHGIGTQNAQYHLAQSGRIGAPAGLSSYALSDMYNLPQQQNPPTTPSPELLLSCAQLAPAAADPSCNRGMCCQQHGSTVSGAGGLGVHLSAQIPLQYLCQDAAVGLDASGSFAAVTTTTSGRSQLVRQGSLRIPTVRNKPAVRSKNAVLMSQLGLYNHDIAAVLHAYNQKLRLALGKRLRRQFLTVFADLERRHQLIMETKQSELDAVLLQNYKLEQCILQAEAQSWAWFDAAKKETAKVNELRTMLEQANKRPVMQRVDAYGSVAEEGSGDNAEILASLTPASAANVELSLFQGEAAAPDNDVKPNDRSVTSRVAVCRSCCHDSQASVVLLPCRHLCVCVACDDAGRVPSCPVCGIHVNARFRVAPCFH